MLQQNTPFKYGLKNASTFLHKLRRQKQSIHNFSHDTVNQKQRTFQQEYIPSSKGSPQHDQSTQFGFKNKKQWMDTIEHKYQIKDSTIIKDNHHNKEPKAKHEGQHKYNETNAQSHSKSHVSHPISLASLVIEQHLKKSLETYTQDLNQMYQNRDNLLQAIQQISIKIKSFTDLHNKNQLYELQNFKSRKQLSFLIKDYHELKVTLQKKKLKVQESFLRKKQKIKVLLQLFQMENQYVVEAESWNFYYKELIENKNLDTENPSNKKVLQLIFPKVESQNQKDKDKKKQKGKVIDKSGLLGDLKSFAKNFKISANQSANQV